MQMTNDFIVPVDAAIQDFQDHLLCHPRTILSAKYGDGKSYFLDAFENNESAKSMFKFITIYPVNYQVLENQDIFDVIKYDILLQMGLNNMLDESVEISDQEAFLYCLKSKGLDLAKSLFDVVGSIEGCPKVKAIGKICSTLIKVIQKTKEAIEEYKEYKNGNSEIIDKYIKNVENASIYEEDLITIIIQKSIAEWRKKEDNSNKHVVLLFEDMDRIDPAHLFRILNIFSAHMDFSYRYGIKPDSSLRGNKFGVDNVVMVIDYDNLESIFHHFYGEETCFEGYIHKFADKGKFVYSLKSEAIKYYYKSLYGLSNVPEETIKKLLPEGRLQTKSLREISNSMDEAKFQYKQIDGVSHDIAILIVCMRRLGYDDNMIVECLKQLITNDIKTWLIYLYPYLKHFEKLNGSSIYMINKGQRHLYDFTNIDNTLKINDVSYWGDNAPFLNINDFLYQVLSLVIK